MKKNLLLILGFIGIFFYSPEVGAQLTLDWGDTTLCPPDTMEDCAHLAGQVDPLNTDDNFTGIINIGFPFEFFGNTYTTCVISGNGLVNFDASNKAGGFAMWDWGQNSSSGDANNAIMVAFCDMYLPDGGQIRYEHFGSVGHRKFIVEWCRVGIFASITGCGGYPITTQLILNEGSNTIEMHTTHLPAIMGSCPSASGPYYGMVTQGVRNANGTSEFYQVNRGHDNLPTNWGHTGANNDGIMFTPINTNGTITYQIDSIPFNPFIILDSTQTPSLQWYSEYNLSTPFHIGSCATFNIDGSQHYYIVKYHGLDNCTNDSVTVQDTVFIHYNTSHDTSDIDICQGDSFNFAGRYLTQSGTYDTLLTNSHGCDSFFRVYLHVNPLPDVSLADSSANQLFCNGGQATLSIAHPASNYTYQWYQDGLTAPGGTNPTFNTSTAGDYQLVVTTDKGCVDTSVLVHLDKNVVDINFDADLLYGCGTDTIQIVNHSDSTNALYSWNFGDGSYPPDSTRSPMHVYHQQGNYIIQLKMTNNFGCIDSLSKIVSISHPLHAAFTPNFDSICQPIQSQVQFNNTSVGATNYIWNFDDGSALSAIASPSHDFTLAGSHNVMLVAYNDIPCYDTAYHIVYVDSTPFIHISSDKRDLCVGEPVTFGANYLNTAKKLIWNFGDGVDWVGADSITHHFDEPASYIITVTGDFPVCPDVNDTLTVRVHSLPLVNLGPDSVMCLEGDPIILKNLAPTDPSASYLWSTGETTPSIRVGHPGEYSLTVSAFDCITTESVKIEKDCYLDIPNAFTPDGNGENDYFLPRQLLQKGATSFQMVIFNRWGQKLFQTDNLNGRGWDGKFNGKDQPEGVYIYQIKATFKNGQAENYSGNVTLIR